MVCLVIFHFLRYKGLGKQTKIRQVYCGLSIIKGKIEGGQTISFFLF